MEVKYTVTQRQRLTELNAKNELLDKSFSEISVRDSSFKETESLLIKENKESLLKLLKNDHITRLNEIEDKLSYWLREKEGFTQVVTPIMISESMLSKMSITEDHPLRNQVFWLEDGRKCLRPMLAPNLYELMRDIHKVTKQPVRIFEAGPCFRKESQGAQHLNEFTMLNVVEFAGTEDGKQISRLKELARGAMDAIGISDYELETTESEVYGKTVDIVRNGTELGSGAYGPHFLDSKWGIFDKVWVGIGFGLERITMSVCDYSNIKRVGRSLAYINGVRLNV